MTPTPSEIYAEHWDFFFLYFRRRVDGDVAVIEDLTADFFLKVYQRLDRYTSHPAGIRPWLSRVARNYLIDWIREQSIAVRRAISIEAYEIEPGFAEFGDHFYRTIDGVLILQKALEELTPEQRQAVECRYIQGLPVRDTAVIMGRTEEAVKKLSFRACRALRRTLVSRGYRHAA